MPQKMTFELIILYITLNPTNSSTGKWYWCILLVRVATRESLFSGGGNER